MIFYLEEIKKLHRYPIKTKEKIHILSKNFFAPRKTLSTTLQNNHYSEPKIIHLHNVCLTRIFFRVMALNYTL